MDSKKIFLISFAFVLLGVFGFYFFTTMRDPATKFAADYNDAVKFQTSGNVEDSIKSLENAVEIAASPSQEAAAKLRLAYTLFLRNQGDDRIRSVALYKEVINNQTLPPQQRAVAVFNLMGRIQGTQDEKFARETVFRGEPFGSYLQNDDIELAQRKAHELSDAIYPNAFAKLQVGSWYAGELRKNPSGLSKDQKGGYIKELQEWTSEAEAILPAMAQLRLDTAYSAYTFQLVGMNKRVIAQFTDKDYRSAENAYKDALRVLSKEDSDASQRSIGMFVRFHYAAALAELYGQGKKDEIMLILRPVYSPLPEQFRSYPFSFYEFLKNEAGQEHDAHGHKRDILSLAKIVPEFAEYLQGKGISLVQ